MEAIITTELCYFFMQGIKPNFSELSREYGIDRHTLKKHYEAGGLKTRKKRTFECSLDKYDQVIQEKLLIKGITIMGIFKLLQDRYHFQGSYSAVKTYIRKKGYKKIKTKNVPHVRFETPYGKQLQVDWKEDIKITTKKGEEIKFQLFAATLGRSRLHRFVITETKTTESFMRCLISVLNHIGGIPQEILTDNMSALVSIQNGHKQKHANVLQFEKDLGVKIRLCKTCSPETKGKVESSNRFISRLKAYNNEIEDKNELEQIVEKLNKDINEEINQETNIAPIIAFKKEKEYLSPLPNNNLLDSYIVYDYTCEVPSTLLVSFKGKKYSVPAKYIHKKVKLIQDNTSLYIYYNTNLIRTHEISTKKTNYLPQDYKEGIQKAIHSSESSIDDIVKENLNILGEICNE